MTGTGSHSSRFPEPLADDDDDVAWALQTAKVQWTRGARPDAVVWLRRAADSADSLGNVWRANDLRRLAEEFEHFASDAAPIAPPPPSIGGDDVDDLLGDTEDSGIVSIPPPPPPPIPSYAPVDDFEMEADPEPFDEEVVLGGDEPDSSVAVVQLLGNEVELTEEGITLDEDEPEEIDAEVIEEEDAEVIEEAEEVEDEDDVIDDDALSVDPAIAPGTVPFEEADEPVTQPQLDDPRFMEIPRRSPAPPPRISSRAPLPPPPPSRVPSPLPPEPEPEPEGEPQLGGVLLGEVNGLEDVPPEGQVVLVRAAAIERINNEEEIGSFGLALVLNGSAHVMPAIADLSCARVGKREIVWSQGNIDDGVALRLVGAEDGTEIAVWDAELVKSEIREFPWVLDDLKALADRFQALAGVAMGPIGERLDDSLRAMVTEKCQIKRLLPNESLATKGKPVGGMYIVAAGRIEVVDGERVESEVTPGDFVFAPQILSNGPAPSDARAGKNGALVLFAPRSVAHELLLSVPPLLEIFAS